MTETISAAEYRELLKKQKKKNKYRNIRTEVDGIKFPSRAEARRYTELKFLERAGEIRDLQLQVKFELYPKEEGQKAEVYIADFVYQGRDGEEWSQVVEDVKGSREGAAYRMFQLKKRLMWENLGIEVREIFYK